jgi:sugar/nucleoside kinase (ribokinase family)
MTNKDYDVIVLDERIFCDIAFTGMAHLPALGEEIFAHGLTVAAGGAFNTVVALRRLGVKVGTIANLGEDFFSRFIYEQMAAEGLDTGLIRHHNRPLPAVTVAVPIDSERAFFSYVEPQEFAPLDRGYLQNIKAQHLHLCSLEVAIGNYEVMKQAKENDQSISLDGKCSAERLDACETKAALGLVDYLMPNATEAMRMTGVDDVEAAVRKLGEKVPHVIVKWGTRGAIAFSAGKIIKSEALKVTPVDTTGAGDCFNAGFIFGVLAGRSVEECMRYGNIIGGLSTLGSSATSTPTYDEFMRCLETCFPEAGCRQPISRRSKICNRSRVYGP